MTHKGNTDLVVFPFHLQPTVRENHKAYNLQGAKNQVSTSRPVVRGENGSLVPGPQQRGGGGETGPFNPTNYQDFSKSSNLWKVSVNNTPPAQKWFDHRQQPLCVFSALQ